MTIETDLQATLRPLVAGKAWASTFPPNTAWPAIRYTYVSAVPDLTVCGYGDDEASDWRIQIDAVAKTAAEADALRSDIMAAMRSFPTPCTCESWSLVFDETTKSHRAVIDYLVLPSSDTP